MSLQPPSDLDKFEHPPPGNTSVETLVSRWLILGLVFAATVVLCLALLIGGVVVWGLAK
jgi:hypothetical protein